ncbi:hypothetical protein [Pararhizobium sp. LjRoot238]|uniref:hypothetical protein n=1 Tax=Pararhizobium sp. LjRoot238 TaxID=3342293 RepID=UPI003ECE00DD
MSGKIHARQGFAHPSKYREARHIRNFVPPGRFISENPASHCCETGAEKKAAIPENRGFAGKMGGANGIRDSIKFCRRPNATA